MIDVEHFDRAERSVQEDFRWGAGEVDDMCEVGPRRSGEESWT